MAGAAVVMPAATVNPVGGSCFQRSARRASNRFRRSVRSISPRRRQQARPIVVDQLQLLERFLPMRGKVAALGHRIPQPRRIDPLDEQAVEGPGEVARKAQALRRSLPPHERRQGQQSLGRIDRRRNRLAVVDAVERSADPLVELGVADRDQARQQQAAAAGPDEGFGDGAHRAVVGKQDAPLGQAHRVFPEALNQPGRQRVRERPMAGNGEDRDAVRHAPGPFPSAGSTGACRHRTTGPDGRPRSSVPPRSPGPTGCWSKMGLRAHRAASASTRSGCR